ncbi:MAG: radical SAM family heme chaperone HemW [Velocimicrobium sp.]
MNIKKDLQLYIHIPFCIKKCKYCDFVSSPEKKEVIDAYYQNLLMEIERYGDGSYPIGDYMVKTIFIGGGTPTSIDASYIKGIMEKVKEVFSFALKSEIEITIEANPGTLTREKLMVYKRLGINRLSIGLQSANNQELNLLGRIHTYEEFLDTYKLCRSCGFTNINIDLMSALPGQTLDSWNTTLRSVIGLNPEHISAYSLIIEEGTPFFDIYQTKKGQLPDEDIEREMYYMTQKVLQEAGYKRYEISNYAKEGYMCQHNIGYWERIPYIGFGLSAASLFENTRFANPCTHQEYERFVRGETHWQQVECLEEKEQMEEFMFLGLRKTAGVRKIDFFQSFHISMESIYSAVIKKLVNDKLLVETQEKIFLTERGIDVSNYVLAKFLLD